MRDSAAHHKPWQLALAQKAGLEIPPTLMTNDPEEASEFARRHEGNVIYKQFIALPDTWRETRRLGAEEVKIIETVRLTPVIFQSYVEAVADLRVTVVGDEFYAASTDLRKAEYPVDVRLNLDMRYEPHQLPSAVEARLRTMMHWLGLEYGAIDMRLTSDGRYVFLEINPAGQFLYIEYMTGQKIAAALAEHLIRSSRQSHRPVALNGSAPRDFATTQ
jgi:glutathione synthase/RimK-type ligase-like ATP-grasp enzyme